MSQFVFRGEILNDNQVLAMIDKAPEVYGRAMINYLRYAGTRYIGSKTKDGSVRKYLNTKTSARGKSWEKKFVNTMRTIIDNKEYRLEAGLLYTTKSKAHEIMESMGQGMNLSKSKYMIIPLNEAYKNKGGWKVGGYFKQMIKKNDYHLIFKNGKIYYVNKITNELEFIGSKDISVKKQFDFDSLTQSVQSSIDRKASKILDKATEDLEKVTVWKK